MSGRNQVVVRFRRHYRSVFTLLEIVVAIALIATISTVVLFSLSTLDVFSGKTRSLESTLFLAVKSASILARNKGEYLSLSYDKRGFFEITECESSKVIKRLFLKKSLEDEFIEATKKGVELDNLPKSSDDVFFAIEQSDIVGSSSLTYQNLERKRITFASDGICEPFSAVVKSNVYYTPLIIKFDNFSGTISNEK